MNLEGFNENQIKAVKAMDGAFCVIAGAGSGKTRVLTYRIANLMKNGVRPDNILATTFTKKASDEMRERLTDLVGLEGEEVHLGTFHSICYKILRDEWVALKDPRAGATLATESWQMRAVKDIMSPPSNKFPNGINLDWQPRQALSFIGFQKNNLIDADGTFIMDNNIDFMEDKLRKLYKEYEKKKAYENKIDFDDMLIECWKLFNQHPDILKRYRGMFKYILVDEYQDTNLAQDAILRQLAEEHKNLFVVGDDYQSIYGFRASRVDLIINFEKTWNATVIPLDINYRSTANIVEWSNRLIKNNVHQYPKLVKPNQRRYKDPVITKAFDEDEEAEIVADEITSHLQDGYKPRDFAILYRTNAQSRALEEQMMKNRIPYVVLGSANFYDRREIKDMIAFLKLSINLDDDASLERIINTPNRFLGKAYLELISDYANDKDLSLYESISKCPASREWRYQGALKLYTLLGQIYELDAKPADKIRIIREMTDYDNWLLKDSQTSDDVDNDRLENLNALVSVAYRFSDTKDFLEYIESMSKPDDTKDSENKVKLMSMHRSKGLEFPIVFNVGVSEGLLPHRNTTDEEEERRLFYVGMTRAKKLLYISFTEWYQMKQTGASMFIEELLNEKDEEYSWL